jgi:hypothetical protein
MEKCNKNSSKNYLFKKEFPDLTNLDEKIVENTILNKIY